MKMVIFGHISQYRAKALGSGQGIKRTTTLLFILKVLWCRHVAKSKSPFENIFQNVCVEILTIFKVLEHPTIDPVHLKLFHPFVSEFFGLSYQIVLHSDGPATAKYWETFLLCPTLSTCVCGLLAKTRRLHY